MARVVTVRPVKWTNNEVDLPSERYTAQTVFPKMFLKVVRANDVFVATALWVEEDGDITEVEWEGLKSIDQCKAMLQAFFESRLIEYFHQAIDGLEIVHSNIDVNKGFVTVSQRTFGGA